MLEGKVFQEGKQHTQFRGRHCCVSMPKFRGGYCCESGQSANLSTFRSALDLGKEELPSNSVTKPNNLRAALINSCGIVC